MDKLSEADAQVYNAGLNQGYRDGHKQGLNEQLLTDRNRYADYNQGYDEGFEHGKKAGLRNG